MKYDEVKQFCEENAYKSRAQRYEAMEKYFGIGAGTIKDIISFDRYLRDILEVDQVGITKEREWHRSEQLAQAEADWDNIFKRTTYDI